MVTSVQHGLATAQPVSITATSTALDTDTNKSITVVNPTTFTYISSTVGNISVTSPLNGQVNCANQITVGFAATPIPLTTATGSATYETVDSFAYNTKVKRIINGTQVEIDQILFKDIQPTTSVIFSKTLVDPVDCTINPNGTLFLQEPIPSGAILDITAYVNPVRLDDPNFTSTGAALAALNVLENEYQVLVSQRNVLVNNKNSVEADLETYNAQLVSKQANLNAQLTAGQQQRGIESEGIAADKAQFEEARANPYKMLQYQQSLLQGLPLEAKNYSGIQQSDLVKAAQGASTVAQLLKNLGISS